MTAQAARHRRQPRPVPLTAARRELRNEGACCASAEPVVCSCGRAHACAHHGETHGHHEED